MLRGGQKAVTDGKSSVSQEETKMTDLKELMEMIQKINEDINSRFDRLYDEMDKFKERAKRSKERLDGRLEGLEHEMKQSRTAVEAGPKGEKTGER